MPFFKIEMEGGYFDYLIIEGETDDDAYDIAVGEFPTDFGEPTGFPKEVENPLAEPWPIITEAFMDRVYARRDAEAEAYRRAKEEEKRKAQNKGEAKKKAGKKV